MYQLSPSDKIHLKIKVHVAVRLIPCFFNTQNILCLGIIHEDNEALEIAKKVLKKSIHSVRHTHSVRNGEYLKIGRTNGFECNTFYPLITKTEHVPCRGSEPIHLRSLDLSPYQFS